MRQVLATMVISGCLGLSVWAAPRPLLMRGSVYQATGQGVYIQNRSGLAFVPYEEAKFEVNGRHVRDHSLVPGMQVAVYAEHGYSPQYMPQAFYTQSQQAHRQWDWTRHLQEWDRQRNNWRGR